MTYKIPTESLLVVLALCFGFLHFQYNEIIFGNDLGLTPFVWREILGDHFYVWWQYNLEGYAPLNILQIPYALINSAINLATMTGYVIWLSITLLLWNYLLASNVPGSSKLYPALLSIVAVFNPYTIVVLKQPITSYSFLLIAVPLVLLAVRNVEKTPGPQSFVVLAATLWIAQCINLAHFGLLLLLIFGALLFNPVLKIKTILLKIVTILLLINLPFLFSIVSNFYLTDQVQIAHNYRSQADNQLITLLYASTKSSLSNILSNSGFSWINQSHPLNESLTLVGALFLLWVVGLVVIIIISSERKRLSQRSLLFIAVSLLFLFMSKGLNQPFQYINEIFAYPEFFIYRNNYDKFFPFFVFALIISAAEINNTAQPNSNRRNLILAIFTLCYSAAVLVSASVDTDYSEYVVPKELLVIKGMIEEDDMDGNILYLPGGLTNGYVNRKWYKGIMSESIFFRKKVFYPSDFFARIDDGNPSSVDPYDPYDFVRKFDVELLNTYFIHYIIFDKTVYEYYEGNQDNPQHGRSSLRMIESKISSFSNLVKVVEYPDFQVYRYAHAQVEIPAANRSIDPTLHLVKSSRYTPGQTIRLNVGNNPSWRAIFIGEDISENASSFRLWIEVIYNIARSFYAGDVVNFVEPARGPNRFLTFRISTLGELTNRQQATANMIVFFVPQLFFYIGLAISILFAVLILFVVGFMNGRSGQSSGIPARPY